MEILIRYILLLLVCCLPAIPVQNRELVQQDHEFIYKDSVSEIRRPINSIEENLHNHCNEKKAYNAIDSVNMENLQWKFWKQIILGN